MYVSIYVGIFRWIMDSSSLISCTKPSKCRKMCTFYGCTKTKAKFPALHFFKFPVTRSVCDDWISNCANDEIVSVPIATLRRRVVCEKHFTRESFTNDSKNRLTVAAIPTLPSLDDEFDGSQAAIVTPRREDGQSDSLLAGNRNDRIKSRRSLFASPATSSKKLQLNVITPSYKQFRSVKGNNNNTFLVIYIYISS